MTHITDNTALILIDVQVGLDEPKYGERISPDAEKNMARPIWASRRLWWRMRRQPTNTPTMRGRAIPPTRYTACRW